MLVCLCAHSQICADAFPCTLHSREFLALDQMRHPPVYSYFFKIPFIIFFFLYLIHFDQIEKKNDICFSFQHIRLISNQFCTENSMKSDTCMNGALLPKLLPVIKSETFVTCVRYLHIYFNYHRLRTGMYPFGSANSSTLTSRSKSKFLGFIWASFYRNNIQIRFFRWHR